MKIKYLFNDQYFREVMNNTIEDYKNTRKKSTIASIIYLIIYIGLLNLAKYLITPSPKDEFFELITPFVIFILIFSAPLGVIVIREVFYYSPKNAQRDVNQLKRKELNFLNKMIYLKNDPDIMMNIHQLLKSNELSKSHVTFNYNEQNRLVMDINLKEFDILQSRHGESLLNYIDKYQLQAYHELNQPLNEDEMNELIMNKIKELNLDLERIESYEDYRQQVDKIKYKNKEVMK